MAVYYFDVKDRNTVRDPYGEEHLSDEAAIERAKVIASEVSNVSKGIDPNTHISIVHESGREVFRIPVPVANFRRSQT